MFAVDVPDILVGTALTFGATMFATSIVAMVKLAMIVTRLEAKMENNDARIKALEDHRVQQELYNENR